MILDVTKMWFGEQHGWLTYEEVVERGWDREPRDGDLAAAGREDGSGRGDRDGGETDDHQGGVARPAEPAGSRLVGPAVPEVPGGAQGRSGGPLPPLRSRRGGVAALRVAVGVSGSRDVTSVLTRWEKLRPVPVDSGYDM